VRKPVDADVKRLVLSALIVALLAAPASAAASWGPRQTLVTRGGGYGQGVALAGNARGDAIAAWEGSHGVRVAYARRGKAFGRPHPLKGAGDGSNPSVAIDGRGNALVLWSYFDKTDPEMPGQRDYGCCFGIRLSVRSAKTGQYRPAQLLTPIGHEVSRLAFAIEGGRIGVAWNQDFSTRIHARFGSRGHRLGHRVHVAGGAYPIGLALLRNGPAVTYLGAGARRASLHQVRVRHGHPVRSRRVSRQFSSYVDIAAATNARGQQVVALTPFDSDAYPFYAGARSVGGSFHLRRLSSTPSAFEPRAAIGPAGAAVVAWHTSLGKIFTAGGRPGERFGPARRFGKRPRDTYVAAMHLAVDSLGRGVLAWVDGPPDSKAAQARGAFRSRKGRIVQARNLGQADNVGQDPILDGRGRARVIWRNAETVRATRAHFP
jgi:hypothetical protein